MITSSTTTGNGFADNLCKVGALTGAVVIHRRRTDYDGLVMRIPLRTGPRRAQESEATPEPKVTN